MCVLRFGNFYVQNALEQLEGSVDSAVAARVCIELVFLCSNVGGRGELFDY